MDQSGRYRSRLARPSGLRPPSVRGSAAPPPAPGRCPAAEGRAPCPSTAVPAPCPGTAAPAPSRLPQMGSAMPRPTSRLPPPRTQRAASPVRTRIASPERLATPPRVASPQRGAIPKIRGLRPPGGYGAASRGLRPPGGYGAASRLPAAPTRALPQPKPPPEPPTAASVPVARVVAPAPRAQSPARTLAVPIPPDSPIAAAAVAAAAATSTPPRRRLPMPSRLRKPTAKAESLVAVPVVQEPGSPPKRILVPESVAASEEETIVAVPKTPPKAQVMEDMDRGAAALPPALLSPRTTQALVDDIDRRWEELQRRLSLEGEGSPLEAMPESPSQVTAVIDRAVANAVKVLDKQEREEEDKVAAALRFIQHQRRMKYIDDRWDELQRSLYGDRYAAPVSGRALRSRSPSPASRRWQALQREAATVPLIEDEEMPEYYSPTARKLSFDEETMSPGTLSKIAAGSAAVLQAIAESAAESERANDLSASTARRRRQSGGTVAGSVPPVDAIEFIDDMEIPAEFAEIDMVDAYEEPIDYLGLDLEDAPPALPAPLLPSSPTRSRRLPPPLRPEILTPAAGGTCCARSPIGSPIGSPTRAVALPNRPTSPFSMPPLRREEARFVDPSDLERFMAGEDEEEEEEEEEEDLYKILKY